MYDSPVPTAPSGPTGNSSLLGGPLMLALVFVLFVGMGIFAYLSLHFYNDATTATKTLGQQKTTAAVAGAADQKTKDALADSIANESPFSQFVAPDAYGSFVIKYPKDWASWVDEEQAGTQVTLIVNPGSVTVTNEIPGLAATKVTLQEETGTQFISNYSGEISEGTMKQSSLTVDGQPAYNFTGQFPNQRSVREVVVPVRDKVLVFDNENSTYATQFDEILAQAKINP